MIQNPTSTETSSMQFYNISTKVWEVVTDQVSFFQFLGEVNWSMSNLSNLYYNSSPFSFFAKSSQKWNPPPFLPISPSGGVRNFRKLQDGQLKNRTSGPFSATRWVSLVNFEGKISPAICQPPSHPLAHWPKVVFCFFSEVHQKETELLDISEWCLSKSHASTMTTP